MPAKSFANGSGDLSAHHRRGLLSAGALELSESRGSPRHWSPALNADPATCRLSFAAPATAAPARGPPDDFDVREASASSAAFFAAVRRKTAPGCGPSRTRLLRRACRTRPGILAPETRGLQPKPREGRPCCSPPSAPSRLLGLNGFIIGR
jgi:hypothetical protein